ncbi:MAG TPA: bifunctional transaldolase/phosoglucose isomerase [Stellaceae bacterium]|nr:bifunctional transaldolase/phosoglucose isomerase [Stellaceae bacterium]
MNALKSLTEFGQAIWCDFLARDFIEAGGLKQLTERDGVTGITSNPSIFEQAIGPGSLYDSALAAALRQGDRAAGGLYEALAIADIQSAADVLRPVYDAAGGADGFVSFEVSPYLALDTAATIAEARRLWRSVGRDNLMIKVPATGPGLPAIRQLIGEGINVNITLLFAQEVYEQVAEAYLGGLEHFTAGGGDAAKIASVASFFVSRIDTAVDTLIDERLKSAGGEDRAALSTLMGKAAVANAKLAYQRYRRIFAGPRWQRLAAKGARPQRLLWASTGTKNKAYRDVLYVEELIGADTVNTMPPVTMDAFRDHGRPRASLEENLDEAVQIMSSLGRVGISIDQVTAKLVEDGVRLFADAFDKLLGAIARKRVAILGNALDAQGATLPPPLQSEVDAALEAWRHRGDIRRLWARDANLWTGADEAKWLGWLDAVDAERRDLPRLTQLRDEIRREGVAYILLLGMGGSSLGPEVFAATFGKQPDFPELLVLDSTDPAQIRSFERRIDPARTLFIVSSKSGTTLEPNILKQYFFARAKAALGADQAGDRFIAITDPGSKLEETARRDGFRHIFFGAPSIGGRYSVLSKFGLVPAATMGLDVARLLEAAQKMVHSCDASVPPADNPGVVLGAMLGVLAKAGRDKLTIVASPAIADFGSWLEQLVAESTGKEGRGLIPVDDEPLGPTAAYGEDRVFVYLRLAAAAEPKQDEAIAALQRSGHPILRFDIHDPYHIGQEFFLWEIATAVAGAIIGINPFDQPDVEASKAKTRELTAAYEKSGDLPPEIPILEDNGIRLFADPANAAAIAGTARAKSLAGYVAAHLLRIGKGDYCALLAFLERSAPHHDALQEIRRLIRDHTRAATCLGFGPRFLHSTGQAYKGGPNSGVFLQITCRGAEDLAVPGRKYGFGIVLAAQARGDFDVLAERGRRVLRVELGPDVRAGLAMLAAAVRG